MGIAININTEELKRKAPIIPYINTFYKDMIEEIKPTQDGVLIKCIFHDEDNSSLMLYNNGTFKCFGCGEYGDIITFVEKVEDVDFQTACQIIARNVGVDLNIIQEKPEHPDIVAFKETANSNMDRYRNNLVGIKDLVNNSVISQQEVQVAVNTIENRGFNLYSETLGNFKIGLTDPEEYKYRTDQGNIDSCFTFPLFQNSKDLVCLGFSYMPFYRIYQQPDADIPKYFNDRNQQAREGQNPNLNGIFIKGNILYGFPQAYEHIVRENFVILVEGYFDVLSMHRCGLQNTVGLMGCNISDSCIQDLKNITTNVVLMLDNDKAGMSGATKIAKKLINSGFRVSLFDWKSILSNPKDPDELCSKSSDEEMAKYIRYLPMDFVLGLISKANDRYTSIKFNEKMRIMNNINPLIETVQDPLMRAAYKEELHKIFK